MLSSPTSWVIAQQAKAIAMGLSLWSQKKNPFLFVEPIVLHLHGAKDTVLTYAATNSTGKGIEVPSALGNGNANRSTGEFDKSRDATGALRERQLGETLHRVETTDQGVFRPDSSTYASLLEKCVKRKALAEGKVIHGHMIDMGFVPGIFLGTKLVIMYAKCGSPADARRVLEEMPKPNMVSCTAIIAGYAQNGQVDEAMKLFQKMPTRDVVSWTAMIAAYARHGYNEEALALYCRMRGEGIEPNKFTFSGVLPACANLASLKHGKEVHGDITRSGFQGDIFVGSSLVDMYAKCGRLQHARQVFDEMSERNVVIWNALIAGYAQNEHVGEALKLFQKMPARDMVSWTAMIAGYAQNGQVDLAMKLFQKMPERDMISWAAMVAGYVQNGQVDEALRFFQKMPERDVVSWTAMIAAYAQNGQVDEAVRLFQSIPERQVVSWNAMIAGYAQNGYFVEALELFRQMQLTCVEPDSVTFTTVLPACANMAALINGKIVHGNIIRSGFQFHISVDNALVDMYAKCGAIEDACQVFEEMPERDIVSWNAMIVGYAKHGCGKKALRLFEEMQHSGTKSNMITFIGVLSACSHAGLVDDGWRYFNLMCWNYQITPSVEHYCCMVDLLGRAGHLVEAQDFINKMPIEPDAAIWGSLLGACRIHTNIEVGERVAKCLFELDSKNATWYVLLSNIYAAAGRWEDAQKVQKMMKEKMVNKIPGCSWIEVNNRVFSFLVGDQSNPQTHQIYAELERLSQQMKSVGYVPDMSLALHDME